MAQFRILENQATPSPREVHVGIIHKKPLERADSAFKAIRTYQVEYKGVFSWASSENGRVGRR